MVVLLGTLGVSAAFVSTLARFGVIATADFHEALSRYWIGVMVGVLITIPLVAMLLVARGRALLVAEV